eukprot:GHVN01031562.1.p1 GENE.GHVN01031562.1~~GHVN01031562.1.p1  ORF type:complete len:104 (+),score=35.71 GHVN01031562.1:195-506(+)
MTHCQTSLNHPLDHHSILDLTQLLNLSSPHSPSLPPHLTRLFHLGTTSLTITSLPSTPCRTVIHTPPHSVNKSGRHQPHIVTHFGRVVCDEEVRYQQTCLRGR